ncbi:MAG: hypothetical protein HQK83_14180 [Fibrobacteria bacterium]|nr:hypothetical protein [Fibrobacteria bacterium]
MVLNIFLKSNVLIKYIFLISVILFGFQSCLFDSNDEPDYPALERNELVGCWYKVSSDESCQEDCYDTLGRVYILVVEFGQNSDTIIQEFYGDYEMDGRNSIHISFERKSVNHTLDSRTGGYPANYTIIENKLQVLNYPFPVFIRSDSINNCQPHWRLFDQPNNWYL